MLLCLDIGNTHIFGGVFKNNVLQMRFRYNTNSGGTSDQLGVFLKNVLQSNGIDTKAIKEIALCSVVPSIDYSLKAACKKYFQLEPFILHANTKTGITIKTQNPHETGADLIAGAIAATCIHPNSNIIIIDFGTVTTLAAISKNKEFLGASFLPGMNISMLSLGNNTAKLFPVEITKPEKAAGQFTSESIQSGLYYGHIGAIKEITQRITQEVFSDEAPILISTGGFAHLFENEGIFSYIESDLVLHGIKLALEMQLNK